MLTFKTLHGKLITVSKGGDYLTQQTYAIYAPQHLSDEIVKYLTEQITLEDYLDYFLSESEQNKQLIVLLFEQQLEMGYHLMLEPQLQAEEEEVQGLLSEGRKELLKTDARRCITILQHVVNFLSEITLLSLDDTNPFNAKNYKTLDEFRFEMQLPLLNVYTEENE